MFALKKPKIKFCEHTAVHAYQWSYIYAPLTCFHSMGICNCISFHCQSIVSKSTADGVALTAVTEAMGSQQIPTKCGYVESNGRFWI